MPIYEYRCTTCGYEFEALQRLADARLTVCPACHKADLRKKLSKAGFKLKGSGWYATDFRNSGAKQPARDVSTKAGAKANGGGAKPEAKSGESGAGTSTTPSTDTRSSDAASASKSAATASSAKTNA